MGHVYVKARVCREKCVEDEFLVDTGSTSSTVTREIADKIGFKPELRATIELATGEEVQVPVGTVIIELDGERAPSLAYIGDGSPVIGVTVLERLGYYVDPIERKLVKRKYKPPR